MYSKRTSQNNPSQDWNIVLDKSANISTQSASADSMQRQKRQGEKTPDTHVSLKTLLLQSDNARLAEDGKCFQGLLYHKSSKLDKCKRTFETISIVFTHVLMQHRKTDCATAQNF